MSPTIINVILWIPFGLVIFIAGLIFCITGYKKGLWRSLISLGVTFVSALISMLLAKIIAGVLAKGTINSILSMMPAEDLETTLVASVMRNMVQAFIAIALFFVIFFILTLILKLVSNAIKREELITQEKGLKWAGLGVRAIDAVVYSLLLLLPLYGTLGAYVPTAETVLKMTAGEEALVYLSAVTEHPLVAVSHGTPVGAVYNQLAKVKSENGVALSLPEVVGAMEETVEKFQALSTATEDNYDEICLDLVKHLRDNVVEAEWSYGLVKEATTVFKNEIVNNMDGADSEDIEAVSKVFDLLDMTEEEYKDNGVVMLDYVEYVLENNLIESLEVGDAASLNNETFYKETAAFLNATEQTVAIKKHVLTKFVSEICNDDEEAIKKIMDSYNDATVTDAAAQQKEVEVLIKMMTSDSPEAAIEVLKELPSLDSSLIEETISNLNNVQTN